MAKIFDRPIYNDKQEEIALARYVFSKDLPTVVEVHNYVYEWSPHNRDIILVEWDRDLKTLKSLGVKTIITMSTMTGDSELRAKYWRLFGFIPRKIEYEGKEYLYSEMEVV